MKNVAPGLYTFDGLIMGRVYLIEDDDGLTIIDGSISFSTQRILTQITGSGRKLTDVKRILLTHAHMDHVGALPELKAQSSGAIITSETEKIYAEGAHPVRRPNPASLPELSRWMAIGSDQIIKGITVDQTVNEGDVIPALGGLQVVETPGHSPGHISFYQPERKILFIGDVLMNAFSFSGVRLPFAAYTTNMDENIRSVQKLAALDVEIACFGHGDPITENANEKIRALAQRISAT